MYKWGSTSSADFKHSAKKLAADHVSLRHLIQALELVLMAPSRTSHLTDRDNKLVQWLAAQMCSQTTALLSQTIFSRNWKMG